MKTTSKSSVLLWMFAAAGVVLGVLVGLLLGTPSLAQLGELWNGIVSGRWNAVMSRIVGDLLGDAAMGTTFFMLLWAIRTHRQGRRSTAA